MVKNVYPSLEFIEKPYRPTETKGLNNVLPLPSLRSLRWGAYNRVKPFSFPSLVGALVIYVLLYAHKWERLLRLLAPLGTPWKADVLNKHLNVLLCPPHCPLTCPKLDTSKKNERPKRATRGTQAQGYTRYRAGDNKGFTGGHRSRQGLFTVKSWYKQS